MDSLDNGHEPTQRSKDKGKYRAIEETAADETAPLLSSSRPLVYGDDLVSPRAPAGRRRRPLLFLLLTVFLSTLVICLIVAIILVAIAYSYNSKISGSVRDEVMNRAVITRGPESIDVLNATDGSMWLQVDVRAGVDAGTAIDIVLSGRNGNNPNPGYSTDGGSITAFYRVLARWAVKRVGSVTASIGTVKLDSETAGHLATVDEIPTISLPLTLDTLGPSDDSWLTPLSLVMRMNVTQDVQGLKSLAEEGWKNGVIPVHLMARNLFVEAGKENGKSWWKHMNMYEDAIKTTLRLEIPDLPGLPSPGKSAPFPGLSDLLTLEDFDINATDHKLTIHAYATVVNPLPDMNMRIPRLPFTVSLASENDSSIPPVAVTNGYVQPFSLTHPNISLSIEGSIPPLPPSSEPLLSSFLSSYLAGQDAPIVLGTPFLPSLAIPAVFPAPNPKPKILRDVHIKDMRINLKGESILASGMIIAHVVLPKGVDVEVDAKRIWPDVLIFDGEVPGEGDDFATQGNRVVEGDLPFPIPMPPKPSFPIDLPKIHLPHLPMTPTLPTTLPTSLPNPQRKHSPKKHKSKDDKEREKEPATIPKEPLPSPLPPRAFARIRPTSWLPSHSSPTSTPLPLPNGDIELMYEVTAEVKDVPLEVLPGRDGLLRGFISKVIFGGRDGALAGVKGTAAVGVVVDGLPGVGGGGEREEGEERVFELRGLPFEGSVRVGKKSV